MDPSGRWEGNINKLPESQHLTASVYEGSEHVFLSIQTQVGGKKTTVLLPKLTPDTEYSITVVALYARGVSRELNGVGKTRKSRPQEHV